MATKQTEGATAQPMRLSPLHEMYQTTGATLSTVDNWQVASAMRLSVDEAAVAREGVALSDRSDRTKIIVEGPGAGEIVQAAFGLSGQAINQGSYVADAALSVYSLRPDRFYVSATAGREEEIVSLLEKASEQSEALVTMTDETDARSELVLVGAEAATCLGRISGLDFHSDEFPNHAAKQSSVAKIRQLVMRHDVGEMPVYTLSGGRSYALYLWETILQAGQDLGMKPIGRQAVEKLNIA